MAQRALASLAHTGAAMSNGSGRLRHRLLHPRGRPPHTGIAPKPWPTPTCPTTAPRPPAFQACIEAAEEAILEFLLAATTMTGNGRTVRAAAGADRCSIAVKNRATD
ncbi:MAG: P1 family peptidase [Caldilineaceae bacterium]